MEVGGREPELPLDFVLRPDSAVFGLLPVDLSAVLQWTVSGEGLRGSGLMTGGDRTCGEGLPWDWMLGEVVGGC